MAELIRGASIPLFERLQGGESGQFGQVMSPAQLELSIGRELSRLLNTRSKLLVREFLESSGTTLDYGIPDMSALSSRSQSDLDLLQSAIARAIAMYEPRLKNVVVRAASSATDTTTRVAITGAVTIDMKLRPLNFELQIDPRHGGLAKAN
ncbi:type VI secretion system baseplate subunit TssE [Rhodoferax saidenbachensis]|uniref:Type VI secretion system protein ImpF n=1 Tax=Rhodoferax saidenbachensis TaxID=1484693 RepID=A0ABU1ZNL9_9BURK|nr:type VI secretion system baseplate subunit TssE [Rhodoferax saidenbachensis]MDR7307142.1 type VI secretion system protein ImpF [Rhodoferax saidenbachensis]